MQSESGTAFKKLIDIKDFPDLGGDPELLETTTLSDPVQTNIPGIQKLDALKFTCNYTKEDFEALQKLEGKECFYAVWFGGDVSDEGAFTPDGSDGSWKWKGTLSSHVTGKGVNEVREIAISIAAATPIVYEPTPTI